MQWIYWVIGDNPWRLYKLSLFNKLNDSYTAYRIGRAMKMSAAVGMAVSPAMAFADAPRTGAAISHMSASELKAAISADTLEELCEGLSIPKPKKKGPRTGSDPHCEDLYNRPDDGQVAGCADPKIGKSLTKLGLDVEIIPGKTYAPGKKEHQCPKKEQCIVVARPEPETVIKREYVCHDGETVDNKDDCDPVKTPDPVEIIKTKYVCPGPTGKTVDDLDDCPEVEEDDFNWRTYVTSGIGLFGPSGTYVPLQLGVDFGLSEDWYLGPMAQVGFPLGGYDSNTEVQDPSCAAEIAGGNLTCSQDTITTGKKKGLSWRIGASTTWDFLKGSAGRMALRASVFYDNFRKDEKTQESQEIYGMSPDGVLFAEGEPKPIDFDPDHSHHHVHGIGASIGLDMMLNVYGPLDMGIQTQLDYIRTLGDYSGNHLDFRVLGGAELDF